ncbi:hypothetical protein PIB30_043721 [Stylosanthes scabra]|uniref:Uncharacterized protein n=1 Tax=Stylosanthes scabra TaxID=79078 RepID=A0ABU6VED5_9FABA|nr:hypothetical protein [Stylosanthes scabra]
MPPEEVQRTQIASLREPSIDVNHGRVSNTETGINDDGRIDGGLNGEYDPGGSHLKFDNCKWGGLQLDPDGLSVVGDTQSSSSCPYPPGFGPCLNGLHVHEKIRAWNVSEIVRETQITAGDRGGVSSPIGAVLSDGKYVVPPHEGNDPGEERLSLLETEKTRERHANQSVLGDAVISEEEETRGEESEETLYLINKDVGLANWVDEEDDRVNGAYQNQLGLSRDASVVRHESKSRDKIYQFGQAEDESELEESWANEDVIEAFESKKLWDKGGLFFDNREEEEVLDKLSDHKGEKRKQKKLRKGRKPPCIQGRALATRKLRPGYNNKFR